ncbi:MAG: nucleotidyltransferase family protein [Pseudomonadota bacterium]
MPRPWPEGPADLLVKARLSPPDRARAAWRAWRAERDFDDALQAEFRLLPGLAPRLDLLEPGADIRPRIEGIRRFNWARNRMRLARMLPFFDVLAAAGVTPMVLKAAARFATSPEALKDRYCRDLDVLIRPEDLARATEAVLAAGWRPMTGNLPGRRRAVPFDRYLHGEPPGTGGGPEIDIHAWASHFDDRPGGDALLWSRARPATLEGRKVMVPAPADDLLLGLLHGAVADPHSPLDWAVDAAAAMGAPGMDWDTFLEEVRTRRFATAAGWGLGYLAEGVGLEVPAHVTAGLASAAHPLEACELSATMQLKSGWSLLDRLAAVHMRRLRRRPTPVVRHVPPRTRLRDRMPLRLGRTERGGAAIELTFERGPEDLRVRQYDVLRDGRWLARLRITPGWLDRALGRRRWRFPFAGPREGIEIRPVEAEPR